MNGFSPSDAQARAIAEIREWFMNRSCQQQIFRLFGYAGSGKSTVLRFALAELVLSTSVSSRHCVPDVVTATFTGKAALVLRRKGTPARTIHSLIYSVIQATEEEVEAAAAKIEEAKRQARGLTGFEKTTAEAAIEAMRQALAQMKHPRFTLNPQSDAALTKLIVLDEVSMVDEEMARDLMSFKKPILVLGDPGQLPPIKGEGAVTRDAPWAKGGSLGGRSTRGSSPTSSTISPGRTSRTIRDSPPGRRESHYPARHHGAPGRGYRLRTV